MQITAELNERLTRVGPGTAMGEVFRRYWQPALLSEEIPTRIALRFACGCFVRTS